MKGLIVERPGELRIATDIPEPKIGPYDALVETVACGICNGTDLKIIEGHLKGFETYPAVLGHESVGRVIETGEKVRYFKKGDLVLRSTLYDPGPKYYSLWGGFAEYGTVSDYKAMINDGIPNVDPAYMTQQVIPDDLDPSLAVMFITLKEVYSALERLGVRKGMKVMITGCGPVGLAMARICKLIGVDLLIVSGHHGKRLDKAGELGADIVLNSLKEDVESVIKSKVPGGIDLFIDAVGRSELVNMGLRLIKPNGKIGIYGIGLEANAKMDWENAPYNWHIHSVQWPIPEEEAAVHDRVVELVVRGDLKLEDFVSHVVPFEDFDKGFELIRSRQGFKVSLVFK